MCSSDLGLSKQFNTGLVGDERYPKTDGREHHVAFLAPIAFNIARTALMPLGRLAMQKALRSGLTRGAGNTVRSGLGRTRPITPADMTGTKLSFSPNVAGRYLMASPEYKFLTGAGGKASKYRMKGGGKTSKYMAKGGKTSKYMARGGRAR